MLLALRAAKKKLRVRHKQIDSRSKQCMTLRTAAHAARQNEADIDAGPVYATHAEPQGRENCEEAARAAAIDQYIVSVHVGDSILRIDVQRCSKFASRRDQIAIARRAQVARPVRRSKMQRDSNRRGYAAVRRPPGS